jgi:hypothetical protein
MPQSKDMTIFMEMTKPSLPLATLSIPISGGTVSVAVEPRKPVFILGRNGTGKSALVHLIFTGLRERTIYMPGSRPSYFEAESLSLTPASRRQLVTNQQSWDSSPDTRWRTVQGTSRNEKAIHDLQSAETQYKIDAANEIRRNGRSSTAIDRLQSTDSPLDRANTIFAQSNLPIQLVIDGGELKATQAGNVYSHARMSDGERSALVFASEVIAAPAGSVFLVDEPELHLHPSIVVPLVAALIAERPDCGFVISTHELELPGSCDGAKAILVRGAKWQKTSVEAWDVDVVENTNQIPESLHIDLLGSRRKILFIEGRIEGKSVSLDQPLYELLFPAVSIRSRESCREVMRAVAGLRATEALHRARAFGLIDHDGMSSDRVAELTSEGIFPIPVFSIESLYYCADVLRAVAVQQSATFGTAAEELLSRARQQALVALKANGVIEHLASRLAERQMRDQIMLQMPSRKSMMEGEAGTVSISIPSPYPVELQRLNALILNEDVEAIVARYPVRESGVLSALAKGLSMPAREEYERAALTRVSMDESLRVCLKAKLGNLASYLD